MTTKPLTWINQQLLLRSSFCSSFLLTLLAFSLGSPGELEGQGSGPVPPDCTVPFVITSASSQPSAGWDNRFVGCTTWSLSYNNVASGFSGLTLTVQSAPSGTAIGTAGTFVTYAGTVVTGINPNTSTTGAETTFNNGLVSIPWIRVTLSGLTGSGTVYGVLQGWTTGHSGSSAGGGGCVGTSATPCVVAGQDPSSTTQILKTDVNGRLLQGAYNTNAAVSVSASGLTKIITHAAGTTTVNHISLSFASAVDFQFEYGTGTNCGTGTTVFSGVYKSILTIALDVPFTVPAGQDLCVNLGTAVAGGGLVIYAAP